MAKNSNLQKAKQTKNDEFYTDIQDINAEVNYYYEYNRDVFKDKILLLPCDDPEWSGFTKFFASNFDRFGLKKLISTSYAAESKRKLHKGESLGAYIDKTTDFEISSPKYDKKKTKTHGKVFILEKENPSDKINADNFKWDYLEGDGDFRSDEVKKLRDEADIIITNPPFSLFRDFVKWIMEADKKFLIIGNQNAITYKEVFPLLQENKIWLGCHSNKTYTFEVPENYIADRRNENGTKLARVPAITWFTNLDNAKRHEPLVCLTMKENLRFNNRLIKAFKNGHGKAEYPEYDNYDAIEVPFVNAIPKDYTGVMGVPISFLDKYCPEQFKILGDSRDRTLPGKHGMNERFVKDYFAQGGTAQVSEGHPDLCYYDNNGKCVIPYRRIMIKYSNEWISSHPEDFKK